MMPPSDVNNTNGTNGAALTPQNASGPLQPRPIPASAILAPLAAPPASTGINAVALLKALRRRLLPALTLGLIVAVAAGIATWYLLPPPKLTARTQLHVSLDPPNPLFPEKREENHDVFLRSQSYLIRDRFVLNAALRDHEGITELSLIKDNPDPLQWLEKEIKVEFPSPEFIHITLSGDRPEELTQIVSAVTDSYLTNVVNKESNLRREQLRKLNKIRDNFDERLGNKRKKLRTLQEANGVLTEKNMAILQQIELEDLQRVKKDLAQVHAELRNLRVELGLNPDWVEQIWPQFAMVNGLLGPTLPLNQVVVGLLHDDAFVAIADPAAQRMLNSPEVTELVDKAAPDIMDLKVEIRKQQNIMEQMEKKLTEEQFQRRIGAEREKLAGLEKALEKRRSELRPVVFENYHHQLLQATQGNRVQKQQKLRLLEGMEREFINEATRLANETKEIRKNAANLGMLQEEIQREEMFWQKAADTILKMELEQEEPPRITQTDKKAVIYTQDETKRKVMVTSGVTIGALALILFAFAWFEFQSRKVHTPDEVVEGLGLNLIGTVPDYTSRGWLSWFRGGVDSAYTESMINECVDMACTMLLHVADREKLQIAMITSALDGEGKTSLASHLSASLARAGRRTLLMDSDLRNPTLHRLFQRNRTPGLSELLRDEVDLTQIIRDTEIPNLRLIPAGKGDTTALQALASDGIPNSSNSCGNSTTLLSSIRARYCRLPTPCG